jgi:hypothetical protein
MAMVDGVGSGVAIVCQKTLLLRVRIYKSHWERGVRMWETRGLGKPKSEAAGRKAGNLFQGRRRRPALLSNSGRI